VIGAGGLQPDVSIIVPVRNGADTLADCLTAVLRCGYPASHRDIVVVDNGSTDASVAIARRFPVRLVEEGRRGAVHARNRGVLESSNEIVAFLDCDCIATEGWLRELTRPFSHPDVAAATGELVAFPPKTAAERYMARRKPRWQEWVSGTATPWFLIGNTAMRRRVFLRLGMLDPAFALGCEDIDLSLRFFEAGLTHQHCPRALVFHRHRTTLRSLFQQQARIGRGQSLILRKHALRPWGPAAELNAWRDLAADAWRLATGQPHREPRVGGDREFACCDLVRKLAQRIGFAQQTVRWRVVDGWRTLRRGWSAGTAS
jgi:GT2 family glycosyltransferase